MTMSAQQRRKSRAGFALKNHLEQIFLARKICYDRGKATENSCKPDFLFPRQKEYLDQQFNAVDLTMLGVKSTCKDRWRQVLSEAQRISHKHLLTPEPAISLNQTEEMKTHDLQLVVQKPLHSTYQKIQAQWLMSLEEFIGVVSDRQVRTLAI